MHTDPDDASELTKAMSGPVFRHGLDVSGRTAEDAQSFHADTLIRPGRGRPRLDAPKEQINIRLDADVLAKLRETGPGWQSRMNALLRHALDLEA